MHRHRLCLALICASFLPPPDARAQIPDREGFFSAIDGRWTWLGADLGAVSQQSTSGPAGQALIGYKFSEWDVALAGDIQGLLTTITHFKSGLQTSEFTRQHVDIEAGYGGADWRLSMGLRGFHFFQGTTYSAPTLAAYYQRDVYGIGPKVGFGGRLPLGDSPWSVVAGANAALLVAQFSDTSNGQLCCSSYWMFVPQLDSELGLNWRVPSSAVLSVTLGGRLAAWFNTAITFNGGYQTTWLEFGPFVRLAYNFGSRAAAKTLRVPQSAAHPGVAGQAVHFAFDDTRIGPIAAGVVRQAATDALYGRPANLSIGGTADNGDSEPERLLAAERVATVKQQLKRLGLNERQIVVARRTEAIALAPVPGRTEANSRVQIIY